MLTCNLGLCRKRNCDHEVKCGIKKRVKPFSRENCYQLKTSSLKTCSVALCSPQTTLVNAFTCTYFTTNAIKCVCDCLRFHHFDGFRVLVPTKFLVIACADTSPDRGSEPHSLTFSLTCGTELQACGL